MKKSLLSALVVLLALAGFFLLRSEPEFTDAFIREQMTECAAKFEAGCYQKVATNLLSRSTFVEILKSLGRMEHAPEIFSRCHELAHYIGRGAYEAHPDIPRLYGEGSPVCHGGFYHGVIEGYFKAHYPSEILQDSRGKLASDITKVCGNIKDYVVPRFYGECVHGIGHAMMLVTDENLPRSLEYCDLLPHQMEKDACYGGVVMQNSWGLFTQGHSTEYLKKDDPMYPCTIVKGEQARSCYAYQAFYFAELTEWKWEEVVAHCLKEPKEYQGGCMTVIGLLQVEHAEDPTQYYATCTLAKDASLIRNCVYGVVDSLGGRYVGDTVPMEAFCAVVSDEDKTTCYMGIGAVAATWSQDTSAVDKTCSTFANATSKDFCLSGASLTKARIDEL